MHLLRNASCVGSDISWSMSIPIQELTVVYRHAGRKQKAAQILLYAPINVMPHLPPPEGDGDKGGDLIDHFSNKFPTPGLKLL